MVSVGKIVVEKVANAHIATLMDPKVIAAAAALPTMGIVQIQPYSWHNKDSILAFIKQTRLQVKYNNSLNS